jgi:hypothetical protein
MYRETFVNALVGNGFISHLRCSERQKFSPRDSGSQVKSLGNDKVARRRNYIRAEKLSYFRMI